MPTTPLKDLIFTERTPLEDVRGLLKPYIGMQINLYVKEKGASGTFKGCTLVREGDGSYSLVEYGSLVRTGYGRTVTKRLEHRDLQIANLQPMTPRGNTTVFGALKFTLVKLQFPEIEDQSHILN